MDHLYRYRSIKSLFEHEELENLSIYFARPEELNDQMEKYMNVIWQGDEIAFQGLFKHYIYTLTKLYIDTRVNPMEQIDVDALPIFIDPQDLDNPATKDIFKTIYNEFIASPDIAQLPVSMGTSKKKFTSDEVLWIFQVINLYAYLVIDTIVRSKIYKQDVFKTSGMSELYDMLKHWEGYAQILQNLISGNYSSQEIEKQKIVYSMEQQMHKYHLEKVIFRDKNTHNINILTFDFPNAYIKNITKLLYNKYCVACFSGTYQNEPMWAHYANNENGICLEFNVKKVDERDCFHLNSVVGSRSNATGWEPVRNFHWEPVISVEYSNEYPEVDFFTSLGVLPMPVIKGFWLCNSDKTQFSSCLEKYNPIEKWRQHYHKRAQQYICTKSKNWFYEQEYRLFQQDLLTPISEVTKNRIANYAIEDLESIIFGRQVSGKNKRKIISIISSHCKTNQHTVKFYDLYYSTITKCLERKPCMEALIMKMQQPQ